MKKILIKFFSKFKDLTKKHEITVNLDENQETLHDLLENLMKVLEINFKDLIFDDDGQIKSDVIVLKNDKEFSILSGKEQMISHGDTLVFISTIHGG